MTNPLRRLGARLVIGHRGACAHAPENTLASFHLALEQGADALELDVHLSADGVPVVIHDPDLARTTDRTGAVAALTVSELQQADAGARFTPDGGRTFPWRRRGVRIPTLADVLRTFPAAPLLIELKTVGMQHAVHRVLEEHDALERCVPASSHDAALEVFRAASIPYSASAREIARLYFGTALRFPAPRARYSMLSVPLRHHGLYVPTRRFVRAAERLGAPVHVWTVDDPEVAARLFADGVSGVVTNSPMAILQGVGRRA